ncbi:FadR/GntR family transcriptional regulator [Rhodococcus sp. (in: high G+C Gram-positive bacteria)]|uniref:FadR/GntR family transcriptional regulator n=2 Tax=Nocardiaceae TaxID=85025 RepID=UPI000BB11639|nr:FCD domain-containing protein [Rhodococcus sp. (in: high G+C Gram-positive bacteria)]
MHHFARAISQGEMRPGDRFPSERALSERFGLSRQSVRKAIRTLADADVVTITSGQGAGSGTHVRSSIVPVDLIAPNRELPNFSDVARVLEARRLFEPPVALFASIRMDERDYDAIHDVLAMQRSANNLESIRSLDIRFHLAIANATHNSVIYQQMESLMQELEIARHVIPVQSPENEIQQTLEIHTETLAAISSGDPNRIAETMSVHLSMMEDAWERASGRKLSGYSRQLRFTLGADTSTSAWPSSS